MSKKFFSNVFCCLLILTILILTLKLNKNALTGEALKTAFVIIGLMNILYGFQNVVVKYIKARWFKSELVRGEKKPC